MASFNPIDPDDAAEPYDELAELRAGCPVSQPLPGVNFVVRHEDVSAVFRNWSTFSNAGGMRLGELKPDEEQTLNEIDPPRHGPIRRMMLTVLSPGAIASAEGYIEQLCRETVAGFAHRGRADLVTELAAPVPSTVVAHMLGVPEADREKFHSWTAQMVEDKARSPGGVRGEGSRQAEHEFNAYIRAQIGERRRLAEPPDDIITRMMQTKLESGGHLTDTEVVTQIRFLLMAGNETTTNLISNLLYELVRVPGRWTRVRDDRSLIPVAIEESLRHDSPVQLMFRTATDDTELSGCPIAKGERVIVSMGSANRDDAAFANAAEFDLERGMVRNHLAFGLGPHLCVGAPLARLQTKHALDAILDAVPTITLAPDFVYEKVNFFAFRGLKHLPVVFPA